MDKSKLFNRRNSVIAAIVALIVFILYASVSGLISQIAVAFASWLWDRVINSIKTSPLIWIISLAIIALILTTILVIIGIVWHSSKENKIELETKEKELDELSKQLEMKNKTINEYETRISTFLQSDNLLADRLHTGINRVFSQTVNFNWLDYITKAKYITMIRIRHSFSEDPAYYRAFEAILDQNGEVTLVMADPRSPSMLLRYLEERVTRLSGNLPGETTWVDGLEELAIILNRLYNWRQRLIQEGREISKLSIKIATNYPSQAFYRFDNQVIFYPYPYNVRGFHSPAFLFTNPETAVHQFLSQCIKAIVDNSLPIEGEIADIWKKYQAGLFSDREVLKYRLTISKGKRTTTESNLRSSQ